MADPNVNLPSRMLILRLASCRVVLWALSTHGQRLKDTLNGFSQALAKAAPNLFDTLLPQLAAVLRSARDLLITRDRQHRDQLARATKFRRERDAAIKPLSTHVAGLRDTFRGTYSPAFVEEVGFALRMPQQPGELHEQAEHLQVRLSEPELALPESRFKDLDLEPPKLAGELRPLVERLGQALEDVSREGRQAEVTKLAKDEALTDFDRIFVWGANMAEALFQMADLPEVAEKVRPSKRRPGLTAEVEAAGSQSGSQDPEADSEEEGTLEAEPEATTEDQPADPNVTP